MKKMNYTFSVPDNKRVRMIVSTDCKNEADDQFALAHHLMTPMFILKGIVPCHFNMFSRDYGDGHTAQASMDEVNKVLDLMDRQGVCPVCKGSEFPMKDEQTPAVSDGAKLIAEEAMKDDPHPLFIACQGALTDVASALLMKPEIADRMTAIWIGGAPYPVGGPEFNLGNDVNAVNVVFGSTMPVWQVPKNVYEMMPVSMAELEYRVRPQGAVGRYLFD